MVLIAVVIGLLYTLPNFYGESPAVQIASAKATVKIDKSVLDTVAQTLAAAKLPTASLYYEQQGLSNTIKGRFTSTDLQLQALDLLNKTLNPDPNHPNYTVALNLLPASPSWMRALGWFEPKPMYLGLDLRGGVYFLLQIDMKDILTSRYDAAVTDLRATLRTQHLGNTRVERTGQSVTVTFADSESRDHAFLNLRTRYPDLEFTPHSDGELRQLRAELTPDALVFAKENTLNQNIHTLHNRINELGVAEPIIQQQGNDRIIVQLPGVQDVAKAKKIMGRTATLEIRMVDDSAAALAALQSNTVPFGLERYTDRNGRPLLVRRQTILTGKSLQDAQAGRDQQTQQPAVHLTLDNKGAQIFRDITRDNIGKRMAILLFENGQGEIVTAPEIRSEIPGGQVQISGNMTAEEAADTALLLRAGTLAAPMSIIEERTIGPTLGADNILKGYTATLYGFLALTLFIVLYYRLFGIFSAIGLAINLLLLLALLSMLQATLTLPGIAAIALTLGMAIDSNVLINERIREELRHGASPQQAIYYGFERAWGTILDSNLTTLIVGIVLFTFGSGPIRGFAVVHCLGILTSMFSSVIGVRALVNLWYGRRKRLTSLSIGQVWKPSP